MGWLQAAVAVGSSALIFAGSWVAARYTSGGARDAAELSARVQEVAVEVDREDRFIQRLTERLGQVEAEAGACREENRTLGRAMAALERKVDLLTFAREEDSRTIEALRQYARALRVRIVELGEEVPGPPFGIDLDG